MQVWIFSKRLFVIFGTSREAGGDYREEEVDVLCSPPVKEEKQEEKQEEKEKLCSPPVKRRSRRIKRK